MRSRVSTTEFWTAIAVLLAPAADGNIAASTGRPTEDGPVLFADVTATAGIDFVETIGDDSMTNIVESTGVGCGFLDYDGDGHLDIYLVSGCWTEGISDPSIPLDRREKLKKAAGRLYRGRGDSTFEDVTAKAGLARPSYGMGIAVADYDNDGDPDIYVTNDGPNFLYRNGGDGTFTEVAEKAGVADAGFGVGAAFLDFDRDGWLDLYLGNYLTYDPSVTPEAAQHIVRSPLLYAAQRDRLFRGSPSGFFRDVTREAGLDARSAGRAMGVGALDFDGDSFLDVFVANDAMGNFLWRNRGDGTFEDRALIAGVAFSEGGAGTASMAVEIADYDGDGRLDILVPDMNGSCLYRNLGEGLFEDVSVGSGLAAALGGSHSWGAALADFDLDGRTDAYVANGSALGLEPQADRLFLGVGGGRFRDVSASAGPALREPFVSRGVSRGDFDNDGDVDLLVAHLNARPSLLRNDSPRLGRHWLEVELASPIGPRDGIGAMVKVRAGGRTFVQPRLSGGSYLSQHDPRLHFGLGEAARADEVEVTWPDGTLEVLKDVPADRKLVVRREAGAKAWK